MIAALAKLDSDQLGFSSEPLQDGATAADSIQIVIAEGLEVAVPMAGGSPFQATHAASFQISFDTHRL